MMGASNYYTWTILILGQYCLDTLNETILCTRIYSQRQRSPFK